MKIKMDSGKIKTAVLFCGEGLNSYYYDWLQAFINSPLYETDSYNLYDLKNVKLLQNKILDYDAIIALHSTNASGNNFKFNFPYIPILNKRKGKLVMFVGNEVNVPRIGERLFDRLQLINYLKPDYIATQLPLDKAKVLYNDFDSEVIEVTHGLNPEVFKPIKNQTERTIDIGLRTGKYAPYLGDNDRNLIIDYFKENAIKYNLVTDIDTEYKNKLDPSQWAGFLNSIKGTIGNESGGYFLEKNDRTVSEVRKYIYEKLDLRDPAVFVKLSNFFSKYHPSLNYTALLKAEHYLRKILPKRWKYEFDYNNSIPLVNFDFDEIFDKFYRNYQNPLSGRAISSRHFDAIGTKTCQMLLNGYYNGILLPDLHYISVNSDFSNIDDVIRRFKDDEYRTDMVNNTYDYVMNNHTLEHRVMHLYNQLKK